jgi:hypothetical protein
MDATDALLEHGQVPGQLEVDAGVGGPLQVETHAARVAERKLFIRGHGEVISDLTWSRRWA